ncbi:hypothetical protein ACFX11_030876 [Malus domestica]
MEDQSAGCCRCCFSLIFTLGLIALFMWLSVDTKSSTLFVTLRLKNTNNDKRVLYDAVNHTFRWHRMDRRCFNIIFTLGLTALSMWLSLRTSNPKCTIHSFYLPALNRTLNDTKNTTLFVALRLKNTNSEKGVYYDAVNLTFRLLPNATSMPVATSAVPRFYQGHKKTATKNLVVGPQEWLNWTAVFSGVHPNGSVNFRVDLATAVRFKIMFWKTKRHRLNVGADVLVNDSGGKVNEKDIKLSAAPDHHLIGFFSGQVGVLSNFWVLILLNFL